MHSVRFPSYHIILKGIVIMNKTELIEVVSSKAKITKAEAAEVINTTFDAISDGLASDGRRIPVFRNGSWCF